MALDSIYSSGKTLEQRAKENNRDLDMQRIKETEVSEFPSYTYKTQQPTKSFDEIKDELALMMQEYEERRARLAKAKMERSEAKKTGDDFFAKLGGELEPQVEKTEEAIERTSSPEKIESRYSANAIKAASTAPISEARRKADELLDMLKKELDAQEDTTSYKK